MRNKFKKFFSLVLVAILVLSFNTTTFAQEDSNNTYSVSIGNTVIELNEGSRVEVPMESLLIQPFGATDTVVGNGGTLTVWGSGHYVYWTIAMTIPATSFIGTISTTDITSGFSAGTTAITGFGGSIYAASTAGHIYTAVLDGIAYNGTTAVAHTLSNRITWTP